MEWKKSNEKYTNEEFLLLGKCRVAKVFYNGLVDKDNPKKYTMACYLHILSKDVFCNFETIEQAKQEAEKAVTEWIENAGLKLNE